MGRTFEELILDYLASISPQFQLLPQSIPQRDHIELSHLKDATVNACVWVSPTPDSPPFDKPTIALHRERPRRPHWTGSCDAIRNMKETVHRDWAGRHPRWVLLVKYPSVGERMRWVLCMKMILTLRIPLPTAETRLLFPQAHSV